MSIWRLTLREISHRKAHFVLGLISITAAVAAYIAADMLLRDSSHRDRLILTEMEGKQKQRLTENRKTMQAGLKSRHQDLTNKVIRMAAELEENRVSLESGLEDQEKRLEQNLAEKKSGLESVLSTKRTELEKALADTQSRLRATLQEREKAVAAAGAALEDAMRKITKGLGFNILILPQGQDLNQFHLRGVADAVMPEAFVTKLANSKIVTINHLLPVVTKRIRWEEQDNMEVVLIGTRGEVPLAHKDPKKPLLDMVPKGQLIAGHGVGKKLGLKKDQAVKLLGRDFKVAKIHAERGTLDDSSVWLNLNEAQELLKMQNVINAILALECNCATVDRVGEIRAELAGILPGTQIIERGSKALARAEARNKAKQQADTDLKVEAASARRILTEQIESAENTLSQQQASNDKAVSEQEDKDSKFLIAERDKVGEILNEQKRSLDDALKEGKDLIASQSAKDRDALDREEKNAEALLAAEQTKRDRLRSQKERFADILIPLAMAAAALWIGLLAYGNARRRQSEIGILRAIGLRTSQVLTLFLGKAFYLGLLGAVLGVGTGLVAGMVVCEINWGQVQARQLIQPGNLWIAAGMAPLIAMLGSILPAMVAAQRDPASVLQEE